MEKVNEIQGNIIMINERTSLNSIQSRNKILKTRCNFSKRVFGGEDRFNARIGSRVNEVQQVRGHWRDTKQREGERRGDRMAFALLIGWKSGKDPPVWRGCTPSTAN